MSDTTTDTEPVIGGYGPLSRSSVISLEYAARTIAMSHGLVGGETALFWHLVSVAAKHIGKRVVAKGDDTNAGAGRGG